ncbi:hypothetical protein [Atlantibacter hermannii]|uniref:hypothetical protein n=1 Tax=Atlantibacter hermannii TaxID=565 RepID=UPI0028996B8F|nr:hypothetical protein [Atlantibacter hermannii]
MFAEIDALMRVDAGGITVKEGAAETSMMRLEEWLRTPLGSVYGLPSWGNPMQRYKHEPIGDESSHLVEVAIENDLVTKIRQDLPSIQIQQVRCEAISEDTLNIRFVMPNGELNINMKNS